MAFKKTINANNTEVIKTGENKKFPVGMKFVYAGQTWHVREEFVESGEDFRRIVSSGGDDEILTVKTLMKDAYLVTEIKKD